MKPLYTKKNGTSQRVAAIEVKMPASYPSANVTYGSGSVEDALNNRISVPTTSATEVTSVNGTYNYTATKNGWLSLVGSGGSSGNSFTVRIRDSVLYQYGVSSTMQVPAYSIEPLCCLQIKAGRTYAISTNRATSLNFIE